MSKTDIQIAREANMKPIQEILDGVGVPDKAEAYSPMGCLLYTSPSPRD